MAHVTQRIEPDQVADLLGSPHRAAIAFVRGGTVEPLPVAYHRAGERIWVGTSRESLPPDGAPERVVLLLDDGCYWFELRAVTFRGRLVAGTPPSADRRLLWREFVPEHTVAWDYGRLHEETGP